LQASLTINKKGRKEGKKGGKGGEKREEEQKTRKGGKQTGNIKFQYNALPHS
jgi:hypothetical protein